MVRMEQSKTIRDYLLSIPPENTATRVAFFLAGFIMAVWAAMVPFVKMALQLDEAHLGMVLLCVGLGALIVMPFCGAIVAKKGAKFLLQGAFFVVPPCDNLLGLCLCGTMHPHFKKEPGGAEPVCTPSEKSYFTAH